MVKNVKIDDEAHRLLSVRAAELAHQKGDLCSILIRIALEKIDYETLKELIEEHKNDAR